MKRIPCVVLLVLLMSLTPHGIGFVPDGSGRDATGASSCAQRGRATQAPGAEDAGGLAQAARSTGRTLMQLEVGRRWELVTPSGSQHMTLEVTARAGDAYVVRWDNPFVPVEFRFVISGRKILLAGLNMGTGLATMPRDTVYFDFDVTQGKQWSNTLGTTRVLSQGRNISTGAGQIRECSEFRLTDKKGVQTFWTLSPEVGFVQFGQGRDAFRLAATSRPDAASRPSDFPERGSSRTARHSGAPGSASRAVLIGLDANPTPNEGYGDNSRRNRARMAVNAGVSYLYLHPKWDEVERAGGGFVFSEVDFQLRLAEEFDLPVSLNLRVIDTNQRAIPAPYKSWRFSDPRMAQKLADVLRALAPRLKGRARWIAIGNEVNDYFQSHKGEIDEYAQLIQRVLGGVRELFPQAQFSINFTYMAGDQLNGMYHPLASLADFCSFTYYPLNPDFSFRDPGVVASDFEKMARQAGDKPILFQEIGYASSPLLGSSEDKQALFLENVFQALRVHQGRIIAANFVWMSDLPQSVVDDLGKYYGLANADKFKAFLGSLGYWSRDGKPKKAWTVFAREAPAR